MPNITYTFKYNTLILSESTLKFVSINVRDFSDDIDLNFTYNLGYKYNRLNEKMMGEVKEQLIYKSSVTGKIGYIKHLDIELYVIPQIIELFDMNFIFNPPEIDHYDILLGGYIYSGDEYDYNTARGGVSGNEGFITSQSSPEIKYSSITHNFKSAKKFTVPLTWGKEVKPIPEIRSEKIIDEPYFYYILNTDDSNTFFSITNIRRVYVKQKYLSEFLDELTDDNKEKLAIKFKNNTVINDLRNISEMKFINKDIHLFFVKELLDLDIIKKRFDIENAKWIVVYWDSGESRERYKVFWI